MPVRKIDQVQSILKAKRGTDLAGWLALQRNQHRTWEEAAAELNDDILSDYDISISVATLSRWAADMVEGPMYVAIRSQAA